MSGRIVNTTSGTGLFGNVGQSNYGPAKAAVANLTMITAMEMERYGVTANAISPLARTRMTEALPAMQRPRDGWDPYDPANASPVVAYLCSAASGWLSGNVLRIQGDTVQRVRPWDVDARTTYRGSPGEPVDATALDRGLRSPSPAACRPDPWGHDRAERGPGNAVDLRHEVALGHRCARVTMTDLPDHLAGAPTWSSMLAWWRGRGDPAVVTGTTTWSGAEMLARAAGAARTCGRRPTGRARWRRCSHRRPPRSPTSWRAPTAVARSPRSGPA